MKRLRAFCWAGALAASAGLGACGEGKQAQTAQTLYYDMQGNRITKKQFDEMYGNRSTKKQAQTAQTAPDTRAADEAAIRAVDADWAKAVEAKDVQQGISAYADDATLLAPGEAAATGKEEIQKAWSAMAGAPGFALTFAPTKVTVSRSGDLAYELGEYSLTMNDKKGKPQTTKAKYVVVWGKQPDGKWRVLVDAPTTTR